MEAGVRGPTIACMMHIEHAPHRARRAASWAARRASAPARRPRAGARLRRLRHRLGTGSLAWAGYAASAWAIAYAVGVRGSQGLGGTVGLPGTFVDDGDFRRASLQAGAFLLVVGLGALGFVRPWGLRLPRWALIAPAVAGSAFAIGHALTGYVTKPLHALGVIDLGFPGWAKLDEGKLILWDLLFYEPWFLGLGVLVTLGAVHHLRRTGGSRRDESRIVGVTAAASLLLAAIASVAVAT
jgi:hypothetical protein